MYVFLLQRRFRLQYPPLARSADSYHAALFVVHGVLVAADRITQMVVPARREGTRLEDSSTYCLLQ